MSKLSVRKSVVDQRGAVVSEAKQSSAGISEVRLQLACEAQEQMRYMLSSFGVSNEEQQQSAAGTRKVINGEHDRPSFRVLREDRALSRLLAFWKQDKTFVDKAGSPAVVPIYGKGRTLERLARQFAPQMTTDKVLEMLCEWGDVSRLKGDRVALLGTSVMIHPKEREVALAWVMSQINYIVETAIYNAQLPPERKREGLFQRQVTGVIPREKFASFAQESRPRLQEICDELEDRIDSAGTSTPENETSEVCGFGIFLFREGYKAPGSKK